MTAYALIAAAALVVGVFIGTVGVGGILLIPALAYLGGLTVHTAAWITGFELAGVVAGVGLAHALSVDTLRRLAAALCIVVGAFMLWRNL